MTLLQNCRGAQAAILVIVVFGLYLNSIQGSFHYDDFHSIVNNPHIRSWAAIPTYFVESEYFSADADKAMYRPFLLITYTLNYLWSGYEVSGYHYFNIALHTGCVLVIWSLVRCLYPESTWGPLYAGILFAVNPLCSEPVNYISSRSEILSVFFYLFSFRLFIIRKTFIDVAALFCFGIALLSKEIAITLPAVLILYEWFMQPVHRAWFRHVPFWILGCIYLIILTYNQFLSTAFANMPRDYGEQIATQLKALIYYLKLLIFPVSLNVEHQFYESQTVFEFDVLISIALLVSIIVVCYRLVNNSTNGLFLLWSVVAMAPTLVIPLNILVNEHRLYLSLACLSILTAQWLVKLSLGWPIFATVVLCFTGITVSRNNMWIDEVSLWKDAVYKSPGMPRPHVHFGNALKDIGDVNGARVSYQNAIMLDPYHRSANTNLANLLYEKGHGQKDGIVFLRQAKAHYEKVLTIDPDSREALTNLANVYRSIGNDRKAETLYLRAIEMHPNWPDALYNLAKMQADRGEIQEAVYNYKKIIELEPHDHDVYYQLGNVLAINRDYENARIAYEKANELAPTVIGYRYNLGEVLLAIGDRAWNDGDLDNALIKWNKSLNLYLEIVKENPEYRRAQKRINFLKSKLTLR